MIIFDLDGTLADCNHRKKWVMRPRGSKHVCTDSIPHGNGCILIGDIIQSDGKKFVPDWKLFYSLCDLDLPIEPVIEMWNNYEIEIACGRADIMIWSGRCESVRDKTLAWLNMNVFGLGLEWFDSILKMRPLGDYTPDDQLKERWLDEAIAQGKNIEFVFDDRPKVVRMWKRRGIFVFNCYQRDEEF